MPTTTLSKNLKTTWLLSGSDTVFVMPEARTITTSGKPGVHEDMTGSNNIVRLFGDISVTGAGFAAALFEGSQTRVTVGADAVLSADIAVSLAGSAQRLVNLGRLSGDTNGLDADGSTEIINKGRIAAEVAVNMSQHADPMAYEVNLVTNTRNGVIAGSDTGIQSLGADRTRIHNDGLISGKVYAINDGSDESSIVNTGRIVGKVQLANGTNIFDNVDGVMTGAVFGGLGNDQYRIGADDYTIVDTSGVNSMVVAVRARYKASAGIDEIYAASTESTGKTLIGNGLDNFIQGAAGNDTLIGGKGNDTLLGQFGRDTLTGGLGSDIFRFETSGINRDTITDFVAGTDDLAIYGDIADFAEFLTYGKDSGDDCIFTFSKGQGFTLKGVHLADLDSGDVTLF